MSFTCPLVRDFFLSFYNVQHYTTLITDNDIYYYHDELEIAVPITVSHLHGHMRQWYGDSTKPPVLRMEAPTDHNPYTRQQTDGWSYTMHMLLTSLSTLYQGQVQIL